MGRTFAKPTALPVLLLFMHILLLYDQLHAHNNAQ